MIFLIVLLIAAPIGLLWAVGIDDMHRNHPDYKGEDLFNEEEENKK